MPGGKFEPMQCSYYLINVINIVNNNVNIVDESVGTKQRHFYELLRVTPEVGNF